MPFKSKAQQRYLFSKDPELAKEMAGPMSHKDYGDLPEHVSDQKRLKNQHLKDLSKQYLRKKSVK